MQTVQEVADRYLCSVQLVKGLLEKMGYPSTTSRTSLTPDILAAFDAEWGDKIRAARAGSRPAEAAAEPPPAKTAEALIRERISERLKPKTQVMRIAHAKVTGGRDAQGNRETRLLSDPGPVHAIDLNGTWDGDRWRGEVVPGAVHFFGGAMNSGPTAACGRAHMRAVLGEEFVPADDPVAARQCERCAKIVSEGRGFRRQPGSYDPFCYAYLHVKIDGRVEVQECKLRGSHRGLHRTRDGATWDVGFDDFTPAPLDAARRITKAS